MGVDSDAEPMLAAPPRPDVLEEARSLASIRHRMFGIPTATRIGRYVLRERIGDGGMGVVYAAHDPELDRDVAIKLLKAPTGGSEEPGVRAARFVREAQALASLSHPNVVAVYDVGICDGRELLEHADDATPDGQPFVYVVMELVVGESLAEWLRAGPRAWPEILRVFVDAGRGLAAAHANGLAHRDFKPENVLVGRDGRARVVDFGLARAAGDSVPSEEPAGPAITPFAERITATGTVLGTPAYMAPEQHRGLAGTAASDQYSFCVALAEALHGARPFAGASFDELRRAKERFTPDQLPLVDGSPRRGHEAIVRGLAVDPAERHPSMEALLDALLGSAGRSDRARWRRRGTVALGVTGVVAATIVGVLAIAERRRAAACIEDELRIAAIYDEDAAARVRTALLATGALNGPHTAERVGRHLEEYVASMRSVAREACTLAPDQDRTRARECVAEREREVAAFVASLAAANPAVERGAVAGALALPGTTACIDPAVLRLRATMPSDPQLRTEIDATRDDLVAARNAINPTELERARGLAAAALARAEAIDWAPLRAEASLVVGMVALGEGRFEDAEHALEAAYLAADELALHDVAARAAASLIRPVGVHLHRPADGVRWGRLARAHAQQLGGLGSIIDAEALQSVGNIHLTSAEHAAAEAEFGEALDILERNFGPEHLAIARAVLGIAFVTRERGEHSRAMALCERALAIMETSLGPDHPRLAEALVPLAAEHATIGEYDRAIELNRRALAVLESGAGPDHPEVAKPLSALGNMYRTKGELEPAEAAQRRALAIVEKRYGRDHPEVAVQLNALGGILHAKADYEGALRSYARAMTIWQAALGPMHPDLFYVHNGIGNSHRSLHRLDDARAAYEKAAAIIETAFGPDHPRLAYPLVGIAAVHMLAGEPARAIPLLERAIALRERAGESKMRIGEARFELARALEDTGEHERAMKLAVQARDEFLGEGFAADAATVDAWMRER